MASSCRICVLPDLLVNKIAAGEVVERPASVVKELVENAIDAGATRITVAIEDGGKQVIRVTDDGCGMSPEELRLAVTPHATSKIAVEDDLYCIATMGFRGEALASISSVSKLRIVSRLGDVDEGYELRVAGERLESSQAAGCPEGTSVEVRDLFYNVPARRKFLRGNSTEVGHINEQFARAALARPEMGFELINNRRVTQNLPPSKTRIERIAKFYGVELGSALMHIAREERGIRLEAYAAPPVQSRATTQWQYTYVNGRCIRDRFIQHAIKEAYRGLMEPNRHGVVFLFLTIDPREVDVNVHPTKAEVRWVDSNLIHSQVLSALRETFQRCDLTPALRISADHRGPHSRPYAQSISDRGVSRDPHPGGSHNRASDAVDPAEQDRIRREMAEALKAMTPIQPVASPLADGAQALGSGGVEGSRGLPIDRDSIPPAARADSGQPGTGRAASSTGGHGSARQTSPARYDAAAHGSVDAGQIWRSLYGPVEATELSPGGPADASVAHPAGAREGIHPPADTTGGLDTNTGCKPVPHDVPLAQRPRAIQLHNLYLVTETDDGIIIVDQHALHERIIYEQLRERLTQGTLESQRLLLPETLNVTPHQAALVETNTELLHRLGIEVTPFGTDAIAIHAFPSLLKDTDVVSFVRDLLEKLASEVPEGIHAPALGARRDSRTSGGEIHAPASGARRDSRTSVETETVIHKVLDMMACKAAVKAGDPLTDEEIEALMRQRHLIEKSSSCPHGRPTMLSLTRAELDRQFKRT